MTLCILRVIYQWFIVQHLCSSLDGFENGSSQKRRGEKNLWVEISALASAGRAPPQLTVSS